MTTDSTPVTPADADGQSAGSPVQESQNGGPSELEELRAETAKLKNDLRSQRTASMKQTERDNLLNMIPGLKDKVDAIGQVNAALATGMSTGDVEGLPAKVDSINATVDRQQQIAKYNQLDQMYQDAFVADGVDVLPPDSAERREFDAAWEAASKTGNLDTVYDTLIVTTATLNRLQRGKAQEDLDKAVAAERAASKAKLDDAEVNDLDTGAGAGGGVARSLETLTTTEAKQKINKMNQSELAKARAELLDAMSREGMKP